MPKHIISNKDPKTRFYYGEGKAAAELNVPNNITIALYDLLLYKHLNAPLDQEVIRVGGLEFHQDDLILVKTKPGEYDLLLTEKAFATLKELYGKMRIEPVARLHSLDRVDLTRRQEFVHALDYYFEHPEDDTVKLYSMGQGRNSALYIDARNADLLEQLRRQVIHQRDQTVPIVKESLQGVLQAIETPLLNRRSEHESIEVHGVTIPILACRFEFSSLRKTQLFVDYDAIEPLRELKRAIERERYHASKDKAKPKEWVNATDFAAQIGVPAKYVNDFLRACRAAADDMLRDPVERERFMSKQGNLDVTYSHPKGYGLGAAVPIRLLQSSGQSFLIHRDLVPELTRFFVERVGIPITSPDKRPKR